MTVSILLKIGYWNSGETEVIGKKNSAKFSNC